MANQLLADDPPETWQTVQRLAGLGYDWHNIMHMIARVISDDMYGVLKQRREIGPGDPRLPAFRCDGYLPEPTTTA